MFPKIVELPNHPFLIGFSIINHPFLGHHYFWKHPYSHREGQNIPLWAHPAIETSGGFIASTGVSLPQIRWLLISIRGFGFKSTMFIHVV